MVKSIFREKLLAASLTLVLCIGIFIGFDFFRNVSFESSCVKKGGSISIGAEDVVFCDFPPTKEAGYSVSRGCVKQFFCSEPCMMYQFWYIGGYLDEDEEWHVGDIDINVRVG